MWKSLRNKIYFQNVAELVLCETVPILHLCFALNKIIILKLNLHFQKDRVPGAYMLLKSEVGDTEKLEGFQPEIFEPLGDQLPSPTALSQVLARIGAFFRLSVESNSRNHSNSTAQALVRIS